MEDKRMNEIEEIEATEVDETQDSSNAGALLAGVIGGFIAYAVIGGAKKLRVIIEEKVAAKKLAEAAKTDKAEIDRQTRIPRKTKKSKLRSSTRESANNRALSLFSFYQILEVH